MSDRPQDVVVVRPTGEAIPRELHYEGFWNDMHVWSVSLGSGRPTASESDSCPRERAMCCRGGPPKRRGGDGVWYSPCTVTPVPVHRHPAPPAASSRTRSRPRRSRAVAANDRATAGHEGAGQQEERQDYSQGQFDQVFGQITNGVQPEALPEAWAA